MALKMKKAAPEQAYLKLAFYGNQGSGKTFTALLLAEWLNKQDNLKNNTNKRVAFIDTERGTDFYSLEVPERKVHPVAFDFDRSVTRSIHDVKDFVIATKNDASEYNVIVIDSVTHLWEACKEAWSGGLTSAGTFPKQAWGPIKKPWKAMVEAGLNGEFHFIYCGREGLVFEKDEETGEDSMTGYKIKGEGEAGYEPHVLVQMYQYRNMKTDNWIIKAFFEKDRSGVLMGKTIPWPTGETFAPLYALLAGKQGTFTSTDDSAAHDAKAAQNELEQKAQESMASYEAIRGAVLRATNKAELKAAWELTKGKKKLLGERFEALSALVDGRLEELSRGGAAAAKAEPEPQKAETN
jgi:hypothetical protein